MNDRVIFYISWSVYIFVLLISYILFIVKQKSNFKQNNLLFCVLLFAICILSIYTNITSDYFNYRDILVEMETYTISPYIEYVYSLLANLANYQNNLFRFYIIFPSFLLLYFILKKYSSETIVGITFFTILFSYSFASVIRSSLADTIFWFGLLILIYRKNFFVRLIGILIMIISFFFHKSLFLILLPCIISFFPLKKVYIKPIIVFTCIIILLGRILLPYILNTNIIENDSLSHYSSQVNARDFTPFVISLAMNGILYSYYFLLLYKTKFILLENDNRYNYIYKFLFYSFLFLVFLFFQDISFYVYERFFLHLIIPIIILSTYLLSIDRNVYKICILFIPMFILFQNLYIYMFLQRSGI